jgi:hypothetical protein
MEIIGIILLVLVGGYLFYTIIKDKFFSKKNKKDDSNSKKTKSNKKKTKEPETVQELLKYESITDRGFVKLKNGTYTATLEVTQINQRLNNTLENAIIWKNFRSMLNSVGVRQTLLVQSQYLDISDFINNYDQAAQSIQNLTPQLQEAKEDVINNYKEFAEQKTRDYRTYVIFRFNPKKDQKNTGIESGNAVLDGVLSSFRGQVEQMSEEDNQELAESILEEVSDLAYQMYHAIGIQCVRLNRAGILAQTYATLNRDLTLVQRLHDASESHAFTEFKQSHTAFEFEQQLNEELNQSIDYGSDEVKLESYSPTDFQPEFKTEQRELQEQR